MLSRCYVAPNLRSLGHLVVICGLRVGRAESSLPFGGSFEGELFPAGKKEEEGISWTNSQGPEASCKEYILHTDTMHIQL
jgi:hypothetical protein